jgi:pre-mRNA-splicing factor ISY1
MARNEEKAQSMLNRWIAYKREEASGKAWTKEKRPPNASICETITECEKWRMQILKEIGRKIMIIQNEALGEQRIRDLNDQINNLLKEKGHWERRIIELGGPNYRKYERIADDEFLSTIDPHPNQEQKGYTYKYFGAARNLPGVKELFQRKEAELKAKRPRLEWKEFDAEYYGYNEDDNSELEKLEEEVEKKTISEAIEKWEKEHNTKVDKEIIPIKTKNFHIILPSKEEIQKVILEKKKEELLKKYVGDLI